MSTEEFNEEMSPEVEQIVTEALLNNIDRSEESQREWHRLAKRLSKQKRRRYIINIMRSAACIALVAAVSVLAWRYVDKYKDDVVVYTAKANQGTVVMTAGNKTIIVEKDSLTETVAKNKEIEWKTITVPSTKDFHLHLPDGSRVWLNAGAELSYPTRFGKRREVRLKGEAYFQVAPDAAHPFVVTTGNIAMRVVGTEFNIDATGASPRITLVSGRVDVDNADGIVLASLLPNESAVVDRDTVFKTEVDVENIICWRDGIELFEDDSLENILVSIGSWYNLSVVSRDIPELNNRYHFVYDRRKNVEDAVNMLSKIANIKVNIEKNTIFVD